MPGQVLKIETGENRPGGRDREGTRPVTGDDIGSLDGVRMLDQRREIAELIDQVQPVGLDRIALARARIGKKRLQSSRTPERLARARGAHEVIYAEIAEVRRG